METSSDDRSNRLTVTNALQEMQPEFRAFVAGRVAVADVDEVLQVASIKALQGAHTLSDPRKVRAWLFRIHRNSIIDIFRKQLADRNHADSATRLELPDPRSVEEPDSCVCSLSQAQRLRPSYASILSLVDAEGMRLGEAARMLELSENNASVRLHRARRALKDAMREHCGVESLRDCARCRCVEDNCCAA